jgi:hypothetical protein
VNSSDRHNGKLDSRAISLLEEQEKFLRHVASIYTSGNRSAFDLLSGRDGFTLCYPRLRPTKVDIDLPDLIQLADAGFITYMKVDPRMYTGKPTALGIAWITELDRKANVEVADKAGPDDGPAQYTGLLKGPSERAGGGNNQTAADQALASDSIQAPDPTPGGGGYAPPRIFRQGGNMWTLTFNGKTITMGNAKGLSYIWYLLQHPGQSTPAIELLAITDSAVASLDIGSAGDVLDATAISDYRRRLNEIKSDITEAERNHDLGRKEVLENETEQIEKELASARGLGGRNRRLGDDAERIRKAVSNSISRAIRSIRIDHPELANYLQRSVSRGSKLSYDDDGVPWNF